MFCGPLGKFSPTHREILFIHGGITRGRADSLCSKGELAATSAGSIENTKWDAEKKCVRLKKEHTKLYVILVALILIQWFFCLTGGFAWRIGWWRKPMLQISGINWKTFDDKFCSLRYPITHLGLWEFRWLAVWGPWLCSLREF